MTSRISHWDHRNFVVASVSDFSPDMSGDIRILGEDQHHDLRGIDASHNSGRPAFARDDVPGCDPATDPG